MSTTLGCASRSLAIDDQELGEKMLADARLQPIVRDAPDYRLQVLISRVVDEGGESTLERFGFRIDSEYFYPASSVKTCAVLAAFEALDELEVEVERTTPLVYHPLFADEGLDREDDTNLDGGAITVEHESRKLFLVSDNRAYNRLYELVGHRELNESMWRAGLASTRLHHRLSEFRSTEDQLRTPKIELLTSGETLVVPQRDSSLRLSNGELPGLDAGRGFARAGEIIDEPFSFHQKNWMSLVDLQDMNVMILRPDIDLGKRGFELSANERQFLARAMSEPACESENPVYSSDEYPLGWGKYIRDGLLRVLSEDGLTIYNKVGRAYGFMIENAYVVDEASGRSCFVTATIYTNENQILNDGQYEYTRVGYPFMQDLGEFVAREYLSPQAGE